MSSHLSPAEQEAAEILRGISAPETKKTTKKKTAGKAPEKAPRKITRKTKGVSAKSSKTTPEPETPVEPAEPSSAEPETPVEPVALKPPAAEISIPAETPARPVQPSAAAVVPVAVPVAGRTVASPIEEPGASDAARVSVAPGRRWHQRFLTNMYGAFLTVLDANNRILLFAEGALRVKTGEDTDTVFLMEHSSLLEGVLGIGGDAAFQPDVRRIALSGADRRRGWEFRAREIPALTKLWGQRVPGATRWGILTVGVDPTKRMLGPVPNGTNEEHLLLPTSWKTGDRIPGSSVKDLAGRLAPEAAALAGAMPTAWTLAMTGAALFGGMRVPTGVRVKSDPSLSQLIRDEMDLRARKRAHAEQRRASGYNLAALLRPSSPFGDEQ